MKMQSLLAGAVVAVLSSMTAMAAAPGGKPGTSVAVENVATPLSPAERGELARQFVLKWGDYVQRVHGLDVGTWSGRMVGTFAAADATNFRQALKRSTYEGALATLDGTGHRLTDTQVIDALAKSKAGQVGPYALGETTQDLVFTPLEPCRILDTRGTAAGAIAAGANRPFYAWGFTSWTFQGGSSTNCGTQGQSPEAIVVNVTAVTPAQTGYATLYPANGTLPLAATMIYETGKTLSNGAVVKLGTSGGDFRIFSERAVHYVVDIVGYYDAPYATALQCVDTTDTVVSVSAGATANATAPTCAASYTQTATNCESSTWQMPFVYFSGGICSAQNNSSSTASLRASRTCCRVPGR